MFIRHHSKPWPGTRINRNHPLTTGLVVCVVMNEGSGKPLELINNIQPTHANNLKWINGLNGPCLDFEPANLSTLRYPYNFTDPARISYSFWYRATLATPNSVIFGLTNTAEDLSIAYFTISASPHSGSLAATWRNASGSSWKAHAYIAGVNYCDNDWRHIVCTYEPNIIKIYVNGEFVQDQVMVPASAYSGSITLNGVSIGGLVRTGFYYGDASLDNVMVWNRTLDESEVRSLYSNPWSIFERMLMISVEEATSGIILKTSDLLFDAISDFSIGQGIISLLSTTLDSSQDIDVPGYLYKIGEFGVNITNEFDNQFNVYKYSNTTFDTINDTSIDNYRSIQRSLEFEIVNDFELDYVVFTSIITHPLLTESDVISDYYLDIILKRTVAIEFDVINTFNLDYIVSTSSTTQVLSENFNVVVDYYLNPILRRSLLSEVDVVGDVLVNGVELTPTRTQFDLIADFDVNAIRAIGREFIIDVSDDFNLNFIISINLATQLNLDIAGDYYLDMYVKTALQTQFESTADVYIDAVRNIFATTDFDIDGEYNVEYVIGKIIELYIDSVTDFSTIFSSRTAMDTSFDSITDCDVIITNAVTSFIFTVEFDLIDNEVAIFCL